MTKRKITTDRIPEPPEAPDVERRLRIPPGQWIGLLVLLLILGSSATGLLGRKDRTVSAQQDDVALHVTYPARARYRQDVQFMVRVTNASASAIDTVVVTFPSALVGPAADLQFLPDASAAHEVTITNIGPGATREVGAELRPSYYGRRSGDLIVRAGPRRIALRLTTFILP